MEEVVGVVGAFDLLQSVKVAPVLLLHDGLVGCGVGGEAQVRATGPGERASRFDRFADPGPHDVEVRRVVRAAVEAERVAGLVELREGAYFTTWRRAIRDALSADGIAAQIDTLVARLLDG